jgi:hypothetical protein
VLVEAASLLSSQKPELQNPVLLTETSDVAFLEHTYWHPYPWKKQAQEQVTVLGSFSISLLPIFYRISGRTT